MSTPASPRPPTPPAASRLLAWLGEWAPVALVFLSGVGGLFVRPEPAHTRSILVVLAVTVAVGALIVRRRAPVLALAVVLLAAAAADYGPVTTLAALFAVLTVARIGPRSVITLALAALATGAVLVWTPALHGHGLHSVAPVLSRLVAVGLAVALGLYLRARRDYIGGLQERAERLERERELLAAQAVADERVRIARELHDVVAHNVSLMIVQSQALAATGADPRERAGLERIAAIGREAMSEMNRMLGVLRIEHVTRPAREPQPGVRDLPALVERTWDAGLSVSLVTEGEPCELPPGVDLSAYRIAQEALTNVIRHAHAQRATVTVGFARDALRLTITDDGSTAHGDGALVNGDQTARATGHGLVGMRERVALFGGTLHAGPRPDAGGYRVEATLPL